MHADTNPHILAVGQGPGFQLLHHRQGKPKHGHRRVMRCERRLGHTGDVGVTNSLNLIDCQEVGEVVEDFEDLLNEPDHLNGLPRGSHLSEAHQVCLHNRGQAVLVRGQGDVWILRDLSHHLLWHHGVQDAVNAAHDPLYSTASSMLRSKQLLLLVRVELPQKVETEEIPKVTIGGKKIEPREDSPELHPHNEERTQEEDAARKETERICSNRHHVHGECDEPRDVPRDT
mmetsp:Transcript_69132/g.161902  ORF Transcript_69132/g.161902 Transcript_69132/m.161902 type:complete len:230 (-) Transcript_69132:1077-1766(-)